MEQIEALPVDESLSDGSHARGVIAKFTPRISPAKQQEEWRWWISVYQSYLPHFAEDVRIMEELLDKE